MKKLLLSSSILAIIAGLAMVIGGAWGIIFTYQNVVREKIVTASDPSRPDIIANVPVVGPFTLKNQADIIRVHTLKATGGKVFSEMPLNVLQLDDKGNPVLDASGTPVTVHNTARDIWITATALTTALNLGILTYAFSSLILFFGLVSIWTGITFYVLSKKF